jgi:hypothetical protein
VAGHEEKSNSQSDGAFSEAGLQSIRAMIWHEEQEAEKDKPPQPCLIFTDGERLRCADLASQRITTLLVGTTWVSAQNNHVNDQKTDGPSISKLPGFIDKFQCLTYDGQDQIFVSDWTDIWRVSLKTHEVEKLTFGNLRGHQDGPIKTARFSNFAAMAHHNRCLYLGDSAMIRKIDLETKLVSTIAGSERAGDENGAAGQARFSGISSLCVDPTGKLLLVCDIHNNMIRCLDFASNTVRTIACTSSGDSASTVDGVGEMAAFRSPVSMTCSRQGNIFVAEQGDPCFLRRISKGCDAQRSRCANSALLPHSRRQGTGSYFTSPPSAASLHHRRLFRTL